MIQTYHVFNFSFNVAGRWRRSHEIWWWESDRWSYWWQCGPIRSLQQRNTTLNKQRTIMKREDVFPLLSSLPPTLFLEFVLDNWCKLLVGRWQLKEMKCKMAVCYWSNWKYKLIIFFLGGGEGGDGAQDTGMTITWQLAVFLFLPVSEVASLTRIALHQFESKTFWENPCNPLCLLNSLEADSRYGWTDRWSYGTHAR